MKTQRKRFHEISVESTPTIASTIASVCLLLAIMMVNWMMTDPEILTLVKEYFEVGGIRDDGSPSEYYGTPDAFLKFARAMYEEGYDQGCFEATGGM
jgi:hypothetical protein